MRVGFFLALALATSGARAQSMAVKGQLFATAMAQHVRDSKFSGVPGRVQAQARSYIWDARAEASGTVSALSVRLEASAAVFPWPSSQATAGASASATLTYTSDKPVTGMIEINGAARVKIGDGETKYYRNGTTQIPVTICKTALVVACGTSSGCTVGFIPLPDAIVKAYGPKCAAELTGAWCRRDRTDTYHFEVSKAPNTPFVFLLLGSRRLSLPLPPSNCQLLTDFPIGIPLLIQDGRSRIRFDAPALSGVINAQVLGSERPLPDVFWRTSNALAFNLPR